jgi:hypothetical protein
MSALILMGGFGRDSCYRMRRKQKIALHAPLAKPLFARPYAKLLIPRLGT